MKLYILFQAFHLYMRKPYPTAVKMVPHFLTKVTEGFAAESSPFATHARETLWSLLLHDPSSLDLLMNHVAHFWIAGSVGFLSLIGI